MTERVLSELVELDVDRSETVFGVSPCTAGRVESGTAQAGAAGTITLRAGASAVDSAYTNMTARLTGGMGSVQERKISGYVGATKVATVSPNWRATYLSLPGVSGNYASTPDSVVNSITGDIDIRVKVALNDWTLPTHQTLLAKYVASGNQRSVLFRVLQNSGLLHFTKSVDGVTGIGATSTSAPIVIDGETLWLRITFDVNNEAGGNDVKFYTSTDGVTWTQLGTTVTVAGVTSLFDSNAPIVIGAWDTAGAQDPLAGKIYYAELRNGIGGTVVAKFDASDGNLGDASLASSATGEVWTINASGGSPAALAVAPDATSTYDIIDRPNACYNTFRTCQDKPNYVKGMQTIRLTGIGAPLDKAAPARPYVSRIARAPTELDPEEGLARRSASSITVVDEQCADVEGDPYILDRATVAAGTYWTRFLARNLNFAGRFARIKQAYVDRGTFGAYSTELFVIDKIAGPNGSGELTITLKDPTKLADRSTTPTPTSGKLTVALALALTDMQMTLGTGEGAQYPATGWVRIGDEVIRYDGNTADVLYWSFSSYRAQFGTEAKAAEIGAGVQLCKVWQDAAWSSVLHDVLNNAGLLDANIDIAGIQAEESTWLGADYRITLCLSDPQDNSEILTQLLQPAQAMLWWDPASSQVKVKVFAPQSPSAVSAKTVDEEGYLIDRSVVTERLEDLRITLAAVYFALRSAVANIDESKSYAFGEVTIDADAESANEYNERRVKTFYVPWFGSANLLAMRTHSRRYVARHRDAPENIAFDLDPKDNDVLLGQVVDVRSKSLVDAAGATRSARVLITRKENLGTSIKCRARVTAFDQNYGFIGPSTEAAYPNNNGYFVIGDAAGLLSDGTPCSKII